MATHGTQGQSPSRPDATADVVRVDQPGDDSHLSATTSAAPSKRSHTHESMGGGSPAKRNRNDPPGSADKVAPTSVANVGMGQIPPKMGRSRVVRVQGLPAIEPDAAKDMLCKAIEGRLQPSDGAHNFDVSIVPSCNRTDECAALVDFPYGLPVFLSELRDNGRSSVQLPIEGSEYELDFDIHFLGFTPMYPTDPSTDPVAEYIWRYI